MAGIPTVPGSVSGHGPRLLIRFLHWLTLFLVAATFLLAVSIGFASTKDQAAAPAQMHRSSGVSVWVVTLGRLIYGGGEFGDTFEDTATNTFGGDFSEPTFNKVELRRRSRNKMEVKAGMPDKPSLDPWMMRVPRHTLVENLAFQDIERGT
jgi:hypothetical protein